VKRLNARQGAIATVSAMALALGGITGAATAANAVGWNCTTGYSSVGAWGKCLSGDTYQVKVLCQNIITRTSETMYGNRVSVTSGQLSTVQGCPNFLEQFIGQPWV
jgi:hypothetical protein